MGDGAGGASGSYFSVVPGAIAAEGERLSLVSSTLRSAISFPSAEGAGEFTDIDLALEDFRDDWDGPIEDTVFRLDGLGGAVSQAAVIYETNDLDNAGALAR